MNTLRNQLQLEQRLAQVVETYRALVDTSAVEFALASPCRNWYWESAFPRRASHYFIASLNPVFPPLEYGVGLMRFALPRYYTLFMQMPPMIGHSAASGALLYYVPKLDLFISGTMNQIKKRSLSCNLMVRLVMAVMQALKKP